MTLFGRLSPIALVVQKLGRITNGIGFDFLHTGPQGSFGRRGIVPMRRNPNDLDRGGKANDRLLVVCVGGDNVVDVVVFVAR